ncbi:MAG TPA: hypothetical protein DCY27_04305 [Desulfobacterales bacterium]|nr:hypothetical protein [Desulfobacterales bacterium]
MKTFPKLMLLFGLTFLLLTSSSWAQGRTASRADRGRIHYSTLYKPETVEKIRGEVVSLGKTISGNGRDMCEYLTLKTSKGNVWVVLKPQSYKPAVNLNIKPSDQLEITGSRIMLPGKTALIAAKVQIGNDIMVLRDVKTGRPAWAVGDDWHVR